MRRLVVLLVVMLLAIVAVLLWAVADAPGPVGEAPTEDARTPAEAADVTGPSDPDEDVERTRATRHAADDTEPAEEAPGRRLRVQVLDESGVTLEGVAVTPPGGSLVVTDENGVADLGVLRASVLDADGGVVELQVLPHLWNWDPEVHEVEVAAGEGDALALIRLPTEVVPVLVLRLQPEVPRRSVLRVRFPPAPVNYGRPLAAGRDTVRIVLHPPRREILRLATECPGFENAEIAVEVPREPGDFVVELPLVAGGIAATGQVVEADGRPAAGAVVLAYKGRDPEQQADRVVADDEGRFPIRPGMLGHSIVARRPGIACSRWVDLDEETSSPVVLRLGDGASVHGRVTEEDGRPAANALVWVSFVPQVDRKYLEEVRTGADGRYRLAGLPEGWWVRPTLMWGSPFGPAADGPTPFYTGTREAALGAGHAGVTGGDGWTLERDFVARRFPGAMCRFRLVFPPGAETASEVTASGEGWSRVWEFDPASPEVAWHLDEGETRDILFVVGHWTGQVDRVQVEDRVDQSIDVTMTRRTRVFVQLVDEAGTPVRRADVTIDLATAVSDTPSRHAPDTDALGERVTDESGRAEITALLPTIEQFEERMQARTVADLRLVARGQDLIDRNVHEDWPDWSMAASKVVTRLRSPVDWVIEAPLRAVPEVEIELVDARGRPLPHSSLSFESDTPIRPQQVTTDADGRATIRVFTDLADDESEEAVVSFDSAHGVEYRFNPLVAASTGRFRLVRPEVRDVVLRAVDPDGNPIAGLRLLTHVSERTDADGRMTLAVPVGSFGLRVQPHGFTRMFVELSADADEFELRMEPLLSVWVFVRAPDVRGQRARVIAEGLDGSRHAMMGTSEFADGEAFTHMGLPDNELLIRVFTDDRKWGATARRLPGQDEVRLNLVAREPQRVLLRVLDPDGEPLRDTQVVMRVNGSAGSTSSTMTTDATGELSLELYGDRYQLTVSRNRVGTGFVPYFVEDHRPPPEVIEIRLR